MPVANARYKRPESLTLDEHREIEATTTLSVISYAPFDDKLARCGDCGAAGVIFHCHCLNEERRPVRDLCKVCTIKRAGGEEQVWLKTTCRGLAGFRERNRRQRQPAHLQKPR